jgi:hypothetical protein
VPDPSHIAPWRPRRRPLPHFLGRHEMCPPQTCSTAARLCNEAESEARWEAYLLARDIRPGDVLLMAQDREKTVASNDGWRITFSDGSYTTALVSGWVRRG